MVDSRDISITGKDGPSKEVHDDNLEAPENVIPSASSARTVYDRLRHNHIKRCWNAERIQGMLDGNPPYNPKMLQRAGLSDMCNVNWKDGEAVYKSIALAYWSLFNDVQNIVDFKLNVTMDKGQNAEWGKIMSEEWDRTIRSWPNFAKHMAFHQGELLKFGTNCIIWPDERDWRFKPVNYKNFLLPDQTQNDTEAISTIGVEHKYTAQFLWTIYENLEDGSKGHWNKEALGEILWQLATISDENEISDSKVGCVDIQKRIRNGDTYYDAIYNDDITLVSLLQVEYDEKVTHMMIHPDVDTEEFPYMFDRQYEDIKEATIFFTFSPGEEHVHGNKGIGHNVFSAIEAITQLDCSVLDQARRAGSLLLKSGPNRGRDERQVKFVHGGVIDIGEAEIAQNTMGNNVAQTVEVSRYFKQKVFSNNNISGQDPSQPDRNVQSVRSQQMQATKEAKVQKNMIAHYYEQLDHLFREMIRKMLLAKKADPGAEYALIWKDRCIARGVPEELFDVKKAKTSPDGLPIFIEVFATRSAGSGSQIADQIEMQSVMQILPTLGERGRIAVMQDYISAYRGHRYVDRYFPPEDREQQPTGDDTLASIENNQFSDGKQVVVSPDNNHAVHATNHMRMMKETVEGYRKDPKGQFDKTTTLLQKVDDIMQAAGPHFVKHLFFLSQDPTRAAEAQQLNAEWAVIANFGDQIAMNAARQREAELAEMQREQQAMAEQEQQNTPEHIKARGKIAIDQQKLEAKIEQDRTRDRFKFALAAEQLANSSRLEESKNNQKLAIDARKMLGEEAIKQRETENAQQTSSLQREQGSEG